MYNIGTITTTANSTKVTGTNTKWKDNNSLVSAEQVILIQNGSTIYINSIASIQSNTEMTLSFPVPAATKNVSYNILTTMVNSVSDAANKIVAMNNANVQFSDILNRWMTESGTITVTLPDGTTQKLRTTKEQDKLLDGKLNTDYPVATGDLKLSKSSDYVGIEMTKKSGERVVIETSPDSSSVAANIIYRDANGKNTSVTTIPKKTGTAMHVGDFGIGLNNLNQAVGNGLATTLACGFHGIPGDDGNKIPGGGATNLVQMGGGNYSWQIGKDNLNNKPCFRTNNNNSWGSWYQFWTEINTTKDSNGNLKAASPIVKVFAEHIETNDEAEGITMQKLGIGHYLIKGVVGFNADGAWGINNGFVIPQDHNGKNMVLIDYNVKHDGDIELFVFHQQNADMPERFQNNRIKDFDEAGQPIYFDNYEPCDVPDSRWIDMRVEMPVNSIYNIKKAESERLAKIEAEKAEQEAAERERYGLGVL